MTTERHCLDAETVAAWMDGGLDAAAVAAAEAHASTCERCQTLLATVVRTLPAEDGLARGAEARGPARLWKWWLAPIAATAAAVTLWMVVPQTPMQTSMQPQAAPPPARDTAADTSSKPQAPAQPEAQAPPPKTAAPPGAFAASKRNVPASSANEAKAKVAAGADTAKFDETSGRSDAATSARERSSELRRDQAKREENTTGVAEMRQAAEPTAPAPSVGAIAQLRKQVVLPDIVSPDPLSRWRARSPGTIERSEDGGRIWIPVRILAKEEVLAGASPGRLVCWLVGRNGLVLLATDGTNFTRLPFPESVDLVAVASPEARIATVTTADGRTLRTEDAGRNWRNP